MITRKSTANPGELEVYLDDDNTFRPDISVICDFSKMGDNGYEGAPELIVEVLSPNTAKRDYGKKFECYQACGVKEYWIINPDYEIIEQYVLVDGAFKLLAVRLTKFHSDVFEDLEINPNDVFSFRR